jgi:hypothetical protein
MNTRAAGYVRVSQERNVGRYGLDAQEADVDVAGVMIETAQRVYARLGFGGADGEIVILEEGLEEAIKPNLRKLGLKLAAKGIQQQFSMGVGVGRSDLICVNEAGELVVVELKRGLTSDEAIGQVLRYVGWVRENIAEQGQKIHGWIVAVFLLDPDYAAAVVAV